jgi:3-hydroxyisobutyrate dehydrogenase-like beta-hydroxyacid dehydrogenase
MRIGFIGLGKMGGGMARNIVKKGHPLVVCDLNAEALASLTALGATAAATPAQLAAQVDAVMLSLPTEAADEAVLWSADGLFSPSSKAGPGKSLLVIDTTTLSVARSKDYAARVKKAGGAYVEAPISGGPVGSAAGTLAVMAAGEPGAVEKARAVLDCVATSVVHVGPAGSGTAIKLINQMIYVSYMAAFAEGLALGEELGMPLETLLGVLGPSMAGRPVIENKFDEIRGIAKTGFPTKNALHYLDLAAKDFAAVPSMTPVIDAARASLTEAVKRGVNMEDLMVARKKYLSPDHC